MKKEIFKKQSMDDYKKIDALNSSKIKHILRSPAFYKYKEEEEAKERKAADKKDHLLIGEIAHLAILEPHLLKEKIVLMPKFNRATKIGKSGYLEFMENLEHDKIPLKIDDFEMIKEILKTSLSNDTLMKIVSNFEKEVTAVWEDKEYKRDCKVRFDLVNFENDIIVDLKTTARTSKPTAFSKQIIDFRYDLSAAFYARGYKAVTGRDLKSYYWIVTEKSAPYQITIIKAKEEDLVLGELGNCDNWDTIRDYNHLRGYSQAIKMIQDCEKANHWPNYTNDRIVESQIPDYYLY